MERKPPARFLLLALIPFALNLIACSEEEHVEDLCEDVVCDSPPEKYCDGSVLVDYVQAGVCVDGECRYKTTRAPCPLNHICRDAECIYWVEPETCADLEPCETPPANRCEGNTLISYDSQGECEETEDGPLCVYPSEEEECAEGYECVASGGSASCQPEEVGETCEDIEPCNTPPADYCDETGIVVHAEEGVCEETEDGPQCVYSSVIIECDEETVCEETEDGAMCVVFVPPEDCSEIEPCETPQGPSCIDNMAKNYQDDGYCDDQGEYPICVYDFSETNCSEEETVCEIDGNEAVCVDKCEDVTCGPAPSDECDANELVSYTGERTCDWRTGECQYTETREECAAGFSCLTDVDGVPACVEGTCGIAPAPADLSADGGNCEYVECIGHPACQFGYNFDFSTWIEGLPGFYLIEPSGTILVEVPDSIIGSHAASIMSEGSEQDNALVSAVAFRNLEEDTVYTFHSWLQFSQGNPADSARISLFMDKGGEGSSEIQGEEYSAPIDSWLESRVTTSAIEADDIAIRPVLRFKSQTDADTVITTDAWAITRPYEFQIDADSADAESIELVSVDDRSIRAALNNAGELYVSTNSAGSDEDRIVYIWVGGASEEANDTVKAADGKNGAIPGAVDSGELLALIQAADNNACSWMLYQSNTQDWVTVTDNASCAADEGDMLVGVFDLAQQLYDNRPQDVHALLGFAAAGYNADRDIVVSSIIPEPTNGVEGIVAKDILHSHRAALLVGKAH